LTKILDIMKRFESNIDVFMGLYQKAIEPVSPAFVVTKNDEIILSDPIPLIIASRNESTNGKSVRPELPKSEIALPSPIEIGWTGADVIVVQSQHEMNLILLLQRINFPIDEIEIRVNDSIFQ